MQIKPVTNPFGFSYAIVSNFIDGFIFWNLPALVTSLGRIYVKRIFLTGLTICAALSGLFIRNAVPAAAAIHYSMFQKTIELNGQVFSQLQGFASSGTTYMPIYYVMQVLDKFGVHNGWNGSVWNLSTSKPVQLRNTGGTGKDTIEANGKVIYHVSGIVTGDVSTNKNTTYMPVWYVMQILTDIGVRNTWNGVNWSISASSVPSTQSPPTAKDSPENNSTGTALPNHAVTDMDFWSRSSKKLYIMASTDNDFSATATKPVLSVEPGQTLYLMAYSGTRDISSKPSWYVNSPDAAITNDTASDWTYENYQSKAATFAASKPGIYTVQFFVDGLYSVPLVLIVGMNDLTGTSIQVAKESTGVGPLPVSLPLVSPETEENVTFYPYQPIGEWLPVSGHITGVASTVVVDLENDAGDEWNYTLPVQNGTFQGMVRVPVQGSIHVSLISDFWDMLNRTDGSWSTGATYDIKGPVSTLSELDRALLSSAMMDWNMSTEFGTTASILADNSPSKDTAIAAISNYVSEKVVYDYTDFNANKFIWKNSTLTWQNPVGVCEDISELTASMLKSIDIPAEPLAGTAPPDATPDDHEWIRAYDGTGWLVIDPTWNGSGKSINSSITNEYMTNTDSLTSSHILDSKESYTWQ